jgi:hypothetical protein
VTDKKRHVQEYTKHKPNYSNIISHSAFIVPRLTFFCNLAITGR